MTLTLHNTLKRSDEKFTPLSDDKVTLYTCGPTVYARPHVGNWVAFIYWDILVRTLLAAGYTVERVMNITDVGHLVSDADEGEDKLEKGALREGKTAWEVAEYYAEDFIAGMEKLGLLPPEHLVRATDFIPQQLELVRLLKEKGYTYQTHDGIYFDTTKFPTYADFAHLDLAAQKAGARVEDNPEKRKPWDFALWKFTPAGEKRDMEWPTPDDLLELQTLDRSSAIAGTEGRAPTETSVLVEDEANSMAVNILRPHESTNQAQLDNVFVLQTADRQPSPETSDLRAEHGEASTSNDKSGNEIDVVMGFPGWHLECSAMAMSVLGPTIDIHTGGIDHIPVHHTNEIAQSEAASGQRFANYWLHNNHMKIDGTKVSKSLGNTYSLQQLDEKGFAPMDLKLLILQSHYSNEGNFTFDNLEAAKNRLANWRSHAVLRHQTHDALKDDDRKNDDTNHPSIEAAAGAIREALFANLNTPEALRLIDEAFATLDAEPLKNIHRHGLVTLLEDIDELLGLQLMDATPDISDDNKRLLLERQRVREAKDWKKSDELRDKLYTEGIVVRDTPTGVIWSYTD